VEPAQMFVKAKTAEMANTAVNKRLIAILPIFLSFNRVMYAPESLHTKPLAKSQDNRGIFSANCGRNVRLRQ
jgi:hypothetical protein